MTRGLVLSLLWFLFGALAAQGAGPTEFRIDGHIDAAMAGRLHDAIARGTRTVRVNSTGGDQLAALALAHDVGQAHAALIVDGLCGGPCANYLFVAAAKRTVLPGGLVIFSGTASSALAMVPSDRAAGIGSDYASAASRERDLVAIAKANPALLLEPQLQLRTSCYSLNSRDASGKSYVNYRADFIGWVPSRSYLARAGIRVDGFWPSDPGQFQAALKKAFPGGARGNIASFGPQTPSKLSSLQAELKAVATCDAGRR